MFLNARQPQVPFGYELNNLFRGKYRRNYSEKTNLREEKNNASTMLNICINDDAFVIESVLRALVHARL